MSVTKPGTTGTVSNTNPSVTNAVTPMPTSPANPLVANLDETKIPVPPVGPQVGAELPATPRTGIRRIA
ncbi:MAG: hypothetical protein K6E68_07270 [Lachnospiraceae bacterium]|nr:hypothetical protein [Lachnospiraceae bacterium]